MSPKVLLEKVSNCSTLQVIGSCLDYGHYWSWAEHFFTGMWSHLDATREAYIHCEIWLIYILSMLCLGPMLKSLHSGPKRWGSDPLPPPPNSPMLSQRLARGTTEKVFGKCHIYMFALTRYSAGDRGLCPEEPYTNLKLKTPSGSSVICYPCHTVVLNSQ